MKRVKILLSLAALLISTLAFGQNMVVSGVVKDASSGEAVPFAAIQIKGTAKGGNADANGAYTIQAPATGVLVFSSLGYESVEVPIAGKATHDVVLSPDSKMLKETIVVAFGTATKESFTGSAAVVKSDDIAKVQDSDATRALEGKVAGVQLTTSSGTLGSSPSVVIRGIGTITSSVSTAPLYVVDGIPYSGDMNNINAADIESMTVLKDAASNALYGARGANGVIMITTKKAKAGDAVVNVDANWGLNTKALRNYDVITDPAQYYEAYYSTLYWQDRLGGMSAAAAHLDAATKLVGGISGGGLGYNVYTIPDGQLLIGSNGKINPAAKLGRKVTYNGQDFYLKPDDWTKESYRRSLRQEYNVSVSGTTGRASILASFGYLNNKGISLANDMERYTARIRADYQAKNWLKVGMNAGYANFRWDNTNNSEGNGDTGDIFSTAFNMAPIYPMYMRDGNGKIMKDSHGHTMYDYGGGANGGQVRANAANSNALSAALLNKRRSYGNAFNGTGYAEVRFLKDFKATYNVGVGLDDTRSFSTNNMYYGQYASSGGTITVSQSNSFYFNQQQLLEWNRAFGVNHVDVMLGHENYKRASESLSGYKTKLFSEDVTELDGAVIDGQSCSSSRAEYNTEGYFGRVQYDYDNRIFASASYRRDASSRFHPDHRWGNFWSVGAGWLINKESWFNVNWVDMLKIKASIGSQGNDGIGSYRYVDTYSLGNNEGEIAVTFASKGNEKISWETNTNFNTGFDFEVLKGRISGGFEYFYRKTSDMLLWFTVPASLGYSGYYDNIGDMRNSGVELSLNFNIINTKKVRWDFDVNATHYTSKILSLPAARKNRVIEGHGGWASGNKFIGEGLPLNTFFISKYAGIDKADGLPMWYKDVTDDNGNVTGRTTTKSYSEATQYLADDPTPKVYGGFGTSLQAYGFDFAVQFTYSLGGKTYDSGYANLVANPQGTPGYSFHKDVLKAWTPENTKSSFPRFVRGDQNINAASDRFLVSASYLNIQNAQIGYTIPKHITEKIRLSRARVYVKCDNIWFWSYRKGLDPRYSFEGATNAYMNSPVRTISGGINLTF